MKLQSSRVFMDTAGAVRILFVSINGFHMKPIFETKRRQIAAPGYVSADLDQLQITAL